MALGCGTPSSSRITQPNVSPLSVSPRSIFLTNTPSIPTCSALRCGSSRNDRPTPHLDRRLHTNNRTHLEENIQRFSPPNDTLVPVSNLTPLVVVREQFFNACVTIFVALMIVLGFHASVVNVVKILKFSHLPKWAEAAERLPWTTGFMELHPQSKFFLI